MVILNASDPKTAKQMNDIINNSKHVFILVYMVGCGPCNATRPEWKKMCQSLENEYSSNNDVAILDLDSKFMNEVNGIGDVSGFPTMKYISSKENVIEPYEDSNILNKKRSSDSFIDWIESKVSEKSSNLNNINSSSDMSINELSKLISSKQRHSAKTMRNSINGKSSRKKILRKKMSRNNSMKSKIQKQRKMQPVY